MERGSEKEPKERSAEDLNADQFNSTTHGGGMNSGEIPTTAAEGEGDVVRVALPAMGERKGKSFGSKKRRGGTWVNTRSLGAPCPSASAAGHLVRPSM